MKNLCENMIFISKNNWLNVLQASELLSSKKLELSVTIFLKNSFSLLLETHENIEENENENEDEDEDENNIEIKFENIYNNENDNYSEKKIQEKKSKISFTTLDVIKNDFPYFLENIFTERKNEFPSPPSQILLKYTTKKAKEKKVLQEDSSQNIPVWAILMAGVSYFIFQNVSHITTLGIFMPIFNFLFFVFLLLYTLGYFTKQEKTITFK